MTLADEEYLTAMRAGIKLANARGVTAVHDKDGWLGALRLWQQLEESGSLTLRVWQSIPHDRLDEARRRRSPLGLRQPVPARRLPEGVHGRDARLADRVDARRVRACRSRAARSSPRSCAAARRRASRSVCTRSATGRTARRSTRSSRRAMPGSRAGCASGSSMRSCSLPRTSPGSPRSASPARCSSRTRPPTATSPTSSGRARPTARTRFARCSTRALAS